MQTIIKEQHIRPRPKSGSIPRKGIGLRQRAELIRAEDWHFLKHSLNPESGPVAKEQVQRATAQVLERFDEAGSRLLKPSHAPFFVGILYFLLVVWQISGPELVESLRGRQLGLDYWAEDTGGTEPAVSYASIQSDENWSLGDFSEIDTEEFSAVSISTYRLRPNDTLSDIAIRYGLRLDTLVSYNNIPDVHRMQIGQELQIPSRDGLKYKVQRGDSLESIARAKNTTVNSLLDANNLTSTALAVNQELFIPNARLSQEDLAFALGELFAYPAIGRFTSGFGFRADPFTGLRRFHNGIDFAGAIGTPIRAAMAGRVVHVESQVGNYGKYVIIEHSRGFKTLYAHMDAFTVAVGQYVSQGQQIGRMGNTGRSTGPHLHFTVFENGRVVDPRQYLH